MSDKKGLWQNYNYTSNLFSAAVIKTTTKSAGNILLLNDFSAFIFHSNVHLLSNTFWHMLII